MGESDLCLRLHMPTILEIHPNWEAENTATREEIHSFSIDKVSKEIALLRADFRA